MGIKTDGISTDSESIEEYHDTEYGLPIITVVLGIAGFLITESIGFGVFLALIPSTFVIGLLYDKLMGKGSDDKERK